MIGWQNVAVVLALPAAVLADVTIATFDGAPGTSRDWQTVNDPVMGGRSTSAFTEEAAEKLGHWDGEVRVVPFLGKPGFCTLRTPGRYQEGHFPDLSDTEGITVRLAQVLQDGLMSFSLQIGSKTTSSPEVAYRATFDATAEMQDIFVPWTAFACSWRGQPVPTCPALDTQLGALASVGLSTAFPGTAGKFAIRMESLTASQPPSPPQPLAAKSGKTLAPAVRGRDDVEGIVLENFVGGAPLHAWTTENDPVMGGLSDSAFDAKEDFGEYTGTCRIVPKLAAPGFTIVMTEAPLMGRFPDVSTMDGLRLTSRNAGGNVTSFKVALCDSRIWFLCQFSSYKASFEVPRGDAFVDVFLPWSAFSNKWSPSTGEHTAENPPQAESLRSITQLQIWTEGVAGAFDLQIASVIAVKAPASSEDILII